MRLVIEGQRQAQPPDKKQLALIHQGRAWRELLVSGDVNNIGEIAQRNIVTRIRHPHDLSGVPGHGYRPRADQRHPANHADLRSNQARSATAARLRDQRAVLGCPDLTEIGQSRYSHAATG